MTFIGPGLRQMVDVGKWTILCNLDMCVTTEQGSIKTGTEEREVGGPARGRALMLTVYLDLSETHPLAYGKAESTNTLTFFTFPVNSAPRKFQSTGLNLRGPDPLPGFPAGPLLTL